MDYLMHALEADACEGGTVSARHLFTRARLPSFSAGCEALNDAPRHSVAGLVPRREVLVPIADFSGERAHRSGAFPSER